MVFDNYLPGARYTLELKNGQLLRHQTPLELAQFRADARLSQVWIETAAPCTSRESGVGGC